MNLQNDKETWLDETRLTVIVGHFGSGKTEVSVNLALKLAESGHPVALADLDVVDPYFRSRECARLFKERGIRLIASSQACLDADVPSMPPEVMALFDNEATYGVLDIGGDASGARVLARYRNRLKAENARVFCVVNANRPLTGTSENALMYIKQIESASGLKIDGLINNTHLCNQTAACDVLAGAKLVREVSEKSGIPIICHVIPSELIQDELDLAEPVFAIKLYMKKPWEMDTGRKE